MKRVSVPQRHGICQLFAVLVHNGQCHAGSCNKRDFRSLARLDRQRIGRRVVSGGNRNRNRRFAGDRHSCAAVRVQRIAVDRDRRPGDCGGWINFQFLFGIEDLIGVFRLGAGETLRRRLRCACRIGHAKTSQRRHAVKLERQIHALRNAVRPGLAGAENDRIACRASGERIVNAGRVGFRRNVLFSGRAAYIRINSFDPRAGSAAAQFKIRVQAARKAVRHLHSRGMILQRIFVAVRVKVIRIAA